MPLDFEFETPTKQQGEEDDDNNPDREGVFVLSGTPIGERKKTRGSNRTYDYAGKGDCWPEIFDLIKNLPSLWDLTNESIYGAHGKALETHIVCKTPKNPSPDKHGDKKHLFRCSMWNSHGCSVVIRVVEKNSDNGRAVFELYVGKGCKHDHTKYKGKSSIDYDMKQRTLQLAKNMKPGQLRRQLTDEGFDMNKKRFLQMCGVRYREIQRIYGASEMVNTVAELHRLAHLHSVDWDDLIDLHELDENQYFFELVEQAGDGEEASADIVISTPRLLLNAYYDQEANFGSLLALDGTHNVMTGKEQLVVIAVVGHSVFGATHLAP